MAKRHLLFISLLFLLLPAAYAQETIYFANGNRSVGKLTGAEGEKVKISVNKNGKASLYTLRRENILLAFSDDGRYLIISNLDPDPVKAQEAIDAFHNSPSPRLPHDLLLKAVPPSVIPTSIIYESEDVINYKTVAGTAASINKQELAAIFYRNGRHALLVPPAMAVNILNSTRAEMVRLSTPPPVASVAKQPISKTASSKAAPIVAKADPSNAAKQNSAKPIPQAISQESKISNDIPVAKPAPVAPKPTLTDEQYQQYRASALQRVDEFVVYLNIIANKDVDEDKKDKAIAEATALFMPDATIDVSSANKPGVRKYSINTYLKRLKMLPYASTSIEWSEIQYISELTQAADGNYYGMITGQQTFTGYAENGQDVLYSDVTQKSIKVKLEAYRKASDTGTKLKWAVLLGNIGVVTK